MTTKRRTGKEACLGVGGLYSIFPHTFAPTREHLRLSHLGRDACCKGETHLWCGPCCLPASAATLPAWRQPRPQRPWDQKSKLFPALNSASISGCFLNPCFHLLNKSSPPAWNLHGSDDITDTRKLDLGVVFF